MQFTIVSEMYMLSAKRHCVKQVDDYVWRNSVETRPPVKK